MSPASEEAQESLGAQNVNLPTNISRQRGNRDQQSNQDNQQEPCNWSWLLVHCWVLSEHELNSWCSDSETSNAVLNDC